MNKLKILISYLFLPFRKIRKGIFRLFFGKTFKFLTYNLFLPIFIPFIILICVNLILDNSTYNSVLETILQSTSLFLIVSFFTNIGFWQVEEDDSKDYENRESYIAFSLILGVISVFLFISSTFELTINLIHNLLLVSLIFLFFALYFYYKNPNILHSNPKLKEEEGEEKTVCLAQNIKSDVEALK